MSMPAATYRELLRAPSVMWLLGTSVLGRANQGITGLAVLLLVTQHSTYAIAGLVSAAYMVGGCVAGPVLSRLADARGRRRVLAVTSILFALAMSALALMPIRPVPLAGVALLPGFAFLRSRRRSGPCCQRSSGCRRWRPRARRPRLSAGWAAD